MNFKLLGGILLIVGTSIGAGMLALPIATAELSFVPSIILLFFAWSIMTMGAFLLLEVNLWLPMNSNLISMAGATLGPLGQIVSWLTFLLLLYSLLCAYISGGSDVFRHLLSEYTMVPAWLSVILFTAIFGTIVFLGIKTIDYANRGLMFLKFGAYFLLVIFLFPHISSSHLKIAHLNPLSSASATTVVITSFGYALIIPSLRIYFNGNVKELKKAILIGSLIPLVCYIIWETVIMGIIPLHGPQSFDSIKKMEGSTSGLISTLNLIINTEILSTLSNLFSAVCMLTSFLGVSLCLVDFLSDGFQLAKKGKQNILLHLITFLPPLVIVMFFPNAFISALEYAGIYCIILLILMPALMAWRGRYKKKIARGYLTPAGKFTLIFLILCSCFLIVWSLIA